MILQLNNVVFPFSCEKGGSFFYSQSSPVFTPMRVRCFRRSESTPSTKVSARESTNERRVNSVRKISGAVRSDAQAALLDYLHNTRGFIFVDAEHISKNTPCFLRELMSKIKQEEDVARALSRYLRYHPVNEFELFFESLGLRPKDIGPLLPRKLMFLSDDQALLDNYHVLRDYGIPPNKIGKMYKEATEIFRYSDGVLKAKLKAYEQSGLCQSTVVSLVSCFPTLLIGHTNSELFLFLEKLKELGLESDWIETCLSSKHSYNWRRTLDTMRFLNELGYSDAQMADLFKANPELLIQGKSTYLLVGQLAKLGLSKNEIFAVFLEYPKFLTSKYAKHLWDTISFLREIRMDTKNIAKIISTHVQLIASHSLKKPNSVLENFNGNQECLCQSISENPENLFRLASKGKLKTTEHRTLLTKSLEKKAFLLRLGYVENSDEMTRALKQMFGSGERLQDRFDYLVEAGLDRDDVIYMFRQSPTILNYNKEDIRKKIESLGKYLGYEVESIVTFPKYLTYSIKRINCRFSMYVWAKKKGVVKPMTSISTLVAYNEALFVEYCVNVHPDGPAIWESLKKHFLSR